MTSKKFIPIALTVILVICAIFLWQNQKQEPEFFSKLNIVYNDTNQEYIPRYDDHYEINGVHFMVVSIANDTIVLNADSYLLVNNEESNEIEVKLNKDEQVCFSNNNCVIFKLS